MKGYIQDPQTGYLTPEPLFTGTGFTALQKVTFIETFRKTGNLSKSAKMCGVSRKIITEQFEFDIEFYKAYRFAVESLCDQVEENLLALSKRNPTACFGFLRAYRKGIWTDGKQTDQAASTDKLKGLLDELKKDGKLIDVNKDK